MGLRRWFRRRPSTEDIREEIDSHIAMCAESDGIETAEARRRFGNVYRIREDVRRVWIAAFWDTLDQDARYTMRSWRRSPGFALAAILVLALGLGSATALFSALDRILFRSLPYPGADRLVSVGMPYPQSDGTLGDEKLLARMYVEQWQSPPEPFESVATTMGDARVCDITEEQPERLNCALVEHNLLRVLGVRVVAGRDLTADDELRGATPFALRVPWPPVALISHALWTRRFGADPDIVGRTLELDGERVGVAGVLPADFELPRGSADILLPLRLRPTDPAQLDPERRFGVGLDAVARLKPGISPEAAEVALQPMTQAMLDLFPDGGQTTWRVRPLRDRQVGDASAVSWLLLGATAVLLLIACVTVTNLMLARVATRDREYAIRSAVGAPKSRLARLALTESLLLSLVGGCLGLGLASALLKAFVQMAPASIPKIEQASLDLRVYVVAAILALLAGVTVGLWPAVSVFRSDILQGSRTTSATRPTVRFALVSAQIALTLAMLGGSTLLGRSLLSRVQVPLGFETEGVVTMQVVVNADKYPTPEQRAAFFEQLLERVRQAPGIETAALSAAPSPRGLLGATSNMEVEGQPWDPEAPGPLVRIRDATPGYFETFRIPIVSGRAFVETDRRSPEPLAVVSESLKRLLFGDLNALGQRVDGYLIVGIARDVQNRDLGEDPQPELYFVRGTGHFSSWAGRRSASLSVRTAVVLPIRKFFSQAVADLDPELPVMIETLDQQVADLTERPRFVASLTAAFTGVALLLAATGLYGVVSYLVTERRRDIAVRLALGATPGRVSRQLVGEGGRWIVAGAVLGLLLTWSTGHIIESQLFGVSPTDGASIGIALLVLLVVLFLALCGPAARAARVDPMTALREE